MKLVGIPGSNANRSYNRMLLEYISQHYDYEMEVIDIRPLPLFNESVKETPAEVTAVAQAIEAADAVVIACPEINHSVPASLKSVIEWLSYDLHPLTNKPVLIVGASTKEQGTSRAQVDLRDILISPGVNAHVFGKEDFFMGNAEAMFDEDGQLTDEGTIDFLGHCLADFADFANVINADIKDGE